MGQIPPPVNTTIKCTKVFRFQVVTAAVKQVWSDTDLFYLLGVATAANKLSPIFGSVRLKRISMWKNNLTPPTIAFMAIEYKGTNPSYGNNSVIHSTNAVPGNQTSHFSSKPPKDTYAGSWLTASGYQIALITAPVGTLIDLQLEFTLCDDEAPYNDPSVPAALSVGTLYCHSMIYTAAGCSIQPQGWNYNGI